MLLAAIIFVVCGILVKYCKMYFLIAGYNTMPAEKKEEYDIERIATLFINVMFGMAFLIVLGYLLANWLENPKIQSISFYAALIVGISYLLIRANSNKYKKSKTKDQEIN